MKCCGCCENPCGMITLGVLMLLNLINIAGNLFDMDSRDAWSEDLCSDGSDAQKDVVDATKGFYAFGMFNMILGAIGGIFVLYLGIVGCQLVSQQRNQGVTPSGGACSAQCGIYVGSTGTFCVGLVGFLSMIQAITVMALANDMALADCCQKLSYDMKEGDIIQGDVSSKAENHLRACGLDDDGSDWPFGTCPNKIGTDYVFGCQKWDEDVEGSITKTVILISGIVSLILQLIFCPLCTASVYSATYEVSEIGAGGSGATSGVNNVSTI